MAKDGATRAYIGITKQLQLSLPIPDLSVQKMLVPMFRAMQTASKRLEESYEEKLQATETVRQSLLQKTFTGELT